MRSISDALVVCTDDGSHGRRAVTPQPLQEMLAEGRRIDRVWAIGPAVMMKFCALATQPFGVPTVVNLNAIMVDGTGMCGACRVQVGGQMRFACVDGPEFDAHQVDWDLLLTRQRIYQEEERQALDHWRTRGSVKEGR